MEFKVTSITKSTAFDVSNSQIIHTEQITLLAPDSNYICIARSNPSEDAQQFELGAVYTLVKKT